MKMSLKSKLQVFQLGEMPFSKIYWNFFVSFAPDGKMCVCTMPFRKWNRKKKSQKRKLILLKIIFREIGSLALQNLLLKFVKKQNLPFCHNQLAEVHTSVICLRTVWKGWRWQWKSLWTSLFANVGSEAVQRAPFWQCLLSPQSTNKL